jgi:hypothetical protein
MILTRAILKEAKKWLGCRANDPNRCTDEIKKLYNNRVNNEAWCCKFVWAMTNEACKKLGVKNPLIQTASTSTLLSSARKTLRTDTNPGVGSIFYTTRDGGGHVGFVTKIIDDKKFETIEGNTTNSIGEYGVWSKTRDRKSKQYQFIHLEDLDTFENNIFAPFQFELDLIFADPRSYISVGVLIAGGIIGWKLYKKQANRLG